LSWATGWAGSNYNSHCRRGNNRTTTRTRPTIRSGPDRPCLKKAISICHARFRGVRFDFWFS